MRHAGRLMVAFVLGLGALSCGSSGSSSPCNVSYDCPTGQTCGTLDGALWSCMTSGTGAAGASCSAAAGAAITCGDRLTCLAIGDTTSGSCVAWCDSSTACSGGDTCQAITTTRGAALQLCLPPCDVSYDCPAGQTCWTLDGTTFSCMPAGSSGDGAACDATSTQLTCGQGLFCLGMADPTAGVCAAWCDGVPCPAGQSCQTATTTHGATLHYCQ